MSELNNKINILICDDDFADIRIFKTYLKSTNINCSVAEAVDDKSIELLLANKNHYDVIFMDYNIPGKGGMEWLKFINQKNIAPVIILTGRGDEVVAAEAIKNGAFDYIPKDMLSKYELNKTINNCLERWEIKNERDSMIGIAAHEIRNPLATISGYLEILEMFDDIEPEKQLEIHAIIKERTAHLQTLINNLLDYTRIEQGKISLKKTNYDLILFLKEQMSNQKIKAELKKINLVFSSDLEKCEYLFDKNRFEEVTTNLIDNAIKYSPANSSIFIILTKDEKFINIEIKDEGQGIKEAELKFLFKLFSNVKISNKPTGGETSNGIGLAISKKVVQMHDGKISVKSEYGKGTSFIIELPVS